jgi:hypothetical protein
MRGVIQTLKVNARKRFARIVDKSLQILNLIARWIDGPIVLYSIQSLPDKENQIESPFRKSLNFDIAILLQGPVNQNPEATMRTVSMYRSYWPEVPVVISTWTSSDNEVISNLRNLGAHIQLSDEPKFSGSSNSNYQITSTIAGLQYIEELGSQLTLKTRVDQCLYNSRSLSLLKRMLQEYGDRIVTTDFNSFLFRLYSPNDQLMFSDTSMLQEFWNAAVQKASFFEDIPGPVESKLLISFLKSRGMKVAEDLRSSLEVYRDLYAFVNYEDLDLVWNKGSFRILRSRFPQEIYPSKISFVRNQDWLNLQKGLDNYLEDFSQIKV